jgi:two-component system, OmpR family, sensor histidine kinase VicK
MNYTRPQLAIGIEPIKKAFLDAKSRGVQLRYLTEITKSNILYCKELMKIVHELHHLDGIKGNFMISEVEYLAPLILFEKGKIAPKIIYSNVKQIVEQHQYVFDTFWSNGIPAEQRIKEMEQGIVTRYETRVLESPQQINNHLKYVIENAAERSVCSSIGGMQLIYNNFFDLYEKILNASGRKKRDVKEGRKNNKGIRWITTIAEKDNIDLIKIFLNAGAQIRHVKNLPAMNFAVDNKYFHATIDKMESGKMVQSLLTSNEPAYVNHFNFIFEGLWKSGIDALERIRDIEEGVTLADIEVLKNSAEAQSLYLNRVKNATTEILLILPSINAFIRQEKMGAIQLFKEGAKERNVKVRILMPEPNIEAQTVQHLKQHSPNYIGVRFIQQVSDTKATILLVDRKISLVMEIRDDSKTTFVEAIGLSTYSNSKAGVLSYVSIFENLWIQTELYEDIKKTHEKLNVHDKMQREFINIAAHELRTPIQPILTFSEVLYSKRQKDCKGRTGVKAKAELVLLDIITRNAKRLRQLTSDVLDVTKIETQIMQLSKEQFNLNRVIIDVIKDYRNLYEKSNVKLIYENKDKDVVIEADKARLTQVISNLLSNSVKFTSEGTISTTVENKQNQEVIVSIKDAGTGIDPEILPRLFTKFVTKSTSGIGLGLFISKSIIEAHGGKMWAENNANEEKGAKFTFSLPLTYRD